MSSQANLQQLFQSAHQGGVLSNSSMQALVPVLDIGAQIQAGLGIPIDQVTTSEVVLVTMLIDDSGSIRFAGNSQAIRDGHNLVLDSLANSKQGDNVLVHTRYLNGQILYPYQPLSQAIRMNTGNYDPNGGTPLYDETVVILATVVAKTQELADNGIPVRTVTLVLTDGHDQHSFRVLRPETIEPIVSDLLAQETHIIAAMGVDEGGTDFRDIFRRMGVRREWILTPDNTDSEIRKAFGVFSRSAVRASQSTANFSQTSVGGFAITNP